VHASSEFADKVPDSWRRPGVFFVAAHAARAERRDALDASACSFHRADSRHATRERATFDTANRAEHNTLNRSTKANRKS